MYFFKNGDFEIIVDEIEGKFSFETKYKGQYIEAEDVIYDLADFFDLSDLFQTIGKSLLNYKKEHESTTRSKPITNIR